MDYNSLTRRELQFLCKRNKIAANTTNLAMADALTDLQHVEGLEDMMSLDVMQSPATGRRTSARRKPIREVEVSQSLPHARGTRTVVKGDRENTDANVPKTPAISSRRKTQAASACRKLDAQMKDEEEEEGAMLTPALTSSRRRAPTASASVQRVYNTRLSVKLLEATVAELSLNEGEKSKAVENTNLSMDSSESGMQTPDKLHSISVADETEDKNLNEAQIHLLEITKNGETVGTGADGVPVIEFSSEVLNEVSTVKFSPPRETKDLVEYNQLNDENEYPEKVCENLVGQDSDINVGQDDEHGEPEEEKDGSLITEENRSSEAALSLDFPEGMEDSDSKSEWTDDGSLITDENLSSEAGLSLDFMKDMEDSDLESEQTDEDEKDEDRKASNKKLIEEASQSPALPQDYVRKVVDEIVPLDLLEDIEDSDSKSECASEEKEGDDGKVLDKKLVEKAAQSPALPEDDVVKVSDKVDQSLDLMEDSYLKSERANEDEKDGDSKVSDKKLIEEAAHNPILTEDGISKVSVEKSVDIDDGIKSSNEKSSEKAAQAPTLPKDKIGFEIDFEGYNLSDSENPNNVSIADKNETPKCNQSPEQINPPVEAEFSVPTVKTPNSVRPTPFQSQLSGDQVTDATLPQQPLTDDVMLSYQFPRPTNQATTHEMTSLSDDKENTENSNGEVDEKVEVNETTIVLDPNHSSILQMKKKLKELGLNENGGVKKTAMATRSEEMVAAEPEKN